VEIKDHFFVFKIVFADFHRGSWGVLVLFFGNYFDSFEFGVTQLKR
jgi:hypothetical protein